MCVCVRQWLPSSVVTFPSARDVLVGGIGEIDRFDLGESAIESGVYRQIVDSSEKLT